MKRMLFVGLLVAAFGAQANPAVDAAAMEMAGEQRVHPDRRTVSGQVILGVDGLAPPQGVEVSVPGEPGPLKEDRYPGPGVPYVDEGYPAK